MQKKMRESVLVEEEEEEEEEEISKRRWALTIMPGLTLPLPADRLSLQAAPTTTRPIYNLTNSEEAPGFDNNAWPCTASSCGQTVSTSAPTLTRVPSLGRGAWLRQSCPA